MKTDRVGRLWAGMVWAAALGWWRCLGLEPAQAWLPRETVGFLTVPAAADALRAFTNSPLGRAYIDAAASEFRSHARQKLTGESLGGPEFLGAGELADWVGLAQGQWTLAWISRGTAGAGAGASPDDWIMAMEVGSQEREAAKRLLQWRARLLEGAASRSQVVKFGRAEFFSVKQQASNSGGRLAKMLGVGGGKAAESGPRTVWIGQSGAVVWMGTSTNHLVQAMNRLGFLEQKTEAAGAAETGIAEGLKGMPALKAGDTTLVRGWWSGADVYRRYGRNLGGSMAMLSAVGVPTDKIGGALGLDQIAGMHLHVAAGDGGLTSETRVAAMEGGGRKGLFKLATLESKDAAPPGFVPGNAVEFSRVRLDGQKTWKTAEEILNAVSPQLSGLVRMTLESAGQMQDPTFTVTKSLIANLGDDWVTMVVPTAGAGNATKAKENGEAAVGGLVLIGSPKPTALIGGLKSVFTLLQMQGGEVGIEEREFLGRKIYRAEVPLGEEAEDRALEFSVNGDYVVISETPSLLEALIRGSLKSGPPLAETPAMRAVVQRLAGAPTGYLSYSPNGLMWGEVWEGLRETKTAGAEMPPVLRTLLNESGMKDRLDWSLLPPFSKVARHFGPVVKTAGSDDGGFQYRSASMPGSK